MTFPLLLPLMAALSPALAERVSKTRVLDADDAPNQD
jgi:hypothetical protein